MILRIIRLERDFHRLGALPVIRAASHLQILKSARDLNEDGNGGNFLEVQRQMKAKTGFVLRKVVDEQILMPVGDNIGQFNGTVLMNDVSAFVWEKLQEPVTKEELLQAVLSEFEVDEETASRDLDELLEKFAGLGIIEE